MSPAQTAFLAALPVPAAARVALNFPYPPGEIVLPFVRIPLPVASWRNGWQHFASRRPSFAERHRATVEALLARADRTLFLTGSCGLELFNNLRLPASALRRVTIFAYGPVARRRPDCGLPAGARPTRLDLAGLLPPGGRARRRRTSPLSHQPGRARAGHGIGANCSPRGLEDLPPSHEAFS